MPVTLVILLTINPSLINFKIGIPPATEASNEKNRLFNSAKSANSLPYLAINALLAVIRPFLFCKVAKHKSLATPSSPPINSTITSILDDSAIETASSKKMTDDKSTFLCLPFDFAETAINSIGNKSF